MKHDGESGQALVETAITIPLLLLFLLGAAELGQVTYGAINVSNAAKSASQYGAQMGTTMVSTDQILLAAQNEASVPGMIGSLDMPMPIAMPDGTALPGSKVLNCVASTSSNPTSYTCTYCTCSNPDVTATPFACASAVVTGAGATCTGVSHLEQNLIVVTHVTVKPVIPIPGLPSTYDLYGHAVVKRLQ